MFEIWRLVDLHALVCPMIEKCYCLVSCWDRSVQIQPGAYDVLLRLRNKARYLDILNAPSLPTFSGKTAASPLAAPSFIREG